MSEKEPKDSNEDKSIAGTQIINLHLSDIFKNDSDYTTIKNKTVDKKKGLIAEIISKAKTIAEKDQMIKIKLNGSYCKYFRIGADEFTQNDAAFKDGEVELGTLDERGVFIFSSGTKAPDVIASGSGDGDGEGGGEEKKNTEEASPEATDKILVLLKEEKGEKVETKVEMKQIEEKGDGKNVVEEENVEMNTGSSPQDRFSNQGGLETPKQKKDTQKRTAKAVPRQKWETLVKEDTEMGKLAKIFEEKWKRDKTTPPKTINQQRWSEFVKLRKDEKWEKLLKFIDEQLKIQQERKETDQKKGKKGRKNSGKNSTELETKTLKAMVKEESGEKLKDAEQNLLVKVSDNFGVEKIAALRTKAAEEANRRREIGKAARGAVENITTTAATNVAATTIDKRKQKIEARRKMREGDGNKDVEITSTPKSKATQKMPTELSITDLFDKTQKIINYIVCEWIISELNMVRERKLDKDQLHSEFMSYNYFELEEEQSQEDNTKLNMYILNFLWEGADLNGNFVKSIPDIFINNKISKNIHKTLRYGIVHVLLNKVDKDNVDKNVNNVELEKLIGSFNDYWENKKVKFPIDKKDEIKKNMFKWVYFKTMGIGQSGDGSVSISKYINYWNTNVKNKFKNWVPGLRSEK